jgi:hypothetical protein
LLEAGVVGATAAYALVGRRVVLVDQNKNGLTPKPTIFCTLFRLPTRWRS